jgi:hypothetical protein
MGVVNGAIGSTVVALYSSQVNSAKCQQINIFISTKNFSKLMIEVNLNKIEMTT